MLKAIVSYSKKIPVPESDFSSQGYSLSLETEIPETDAKAIQARLHSTFAMVKDTVEQELANGKTQSAATPDVPENHVEQPKSGSVKASNAQVKYLTDLSTQQGLSISELNAKAKVLEGVSSIYDLSRAGASRLLDSMKKGALKKAA